MYPKPWKLAMIVVGLALVAMLFAPAAKLGVGDLGHRIEPTDTFTATRLGATTFSDATPSERPAFRGQ